MDYVDSIIMKYFFVFSLLAFVSCTVVKTEHHITLDHNISIKLEKEVNDFLDDLYGSDDNSE